jgi:hypothetical protein
MSFPPARTGKVEHLRIDERGGPCDERTRYLTLRQVSRSDLIKGKLDLSLLPTGFQSARVPGRLVRITIPATPVANMANPG